MISSLDKELFLAYNGKLGKACKSRIVVGVAPVMRPHVYEVQNWAELKALACAGNAKILLCTELLPDWQKPLRLIGTWKLQVPYELAGRHADGALTSMPVS